jgi:hypothetical protein
MEMEQRLDAFDERYGGRIDAMARFMKDFVDSTDRRISTLELQIHPNAYYLISSNKLINTASHR